jgi:hypothetical protein
MEPHDIPGVATAYDAGINGALGVPEGVYHFAFEAGTPDELEAKRAELIAKGVRVTPVVDHDWARSIYFKDPNGLLLEYCCYPAAQRGRRAHAAALRDERAGGVAPDRLPRPLALRGCARSRILAPERRAGYRRSARNRRNDAATSVGNSAAVAARRMRGVSR